MKVVDTVGEDGVGEACAVLLAATRRGTSEPAAIRSHAGPDRAATATVEIVSCWPGQPRGICLQRVGVRKGVAKVRQNMGQFALSWFGSQTVWGAPDESHLTTLRTGGMGVQSLPFLKLKRRFRP
jgi:hypothetical protein